MSLSGLRIAVTAATDAARRLTALLESAGVEVLSIPAIDLAEPSSWDRFDLVTRDIDSFEWILFPSSTAVDAFLARRPGPIHERVCAVGEITAARLVERGVAVDLVPDEYTGAAAAAAIGAGDGRVLLVRGEGAPRSLQRAFDDMGRDTEEVHCYRTVCVDISSEALEVLTDGHLDCVTFLSGSAARCLGGSMRSEVWPRTTRVACIGPSTAEVARGAGFGVDVVADDHTAEGLLHALKRAYA